MALILIVLVTGLTSVGEGVVLPQGHVAREVSIPDDWSDFLGSKTIPDIYSTVLERAGWLSYVRGNIDEIQFCDCSAFVSAGSKSIGLSTVRNGIRIARIATSGYESKEVTSTIVHEAAHLEPWSERSQMAEEDYARKVESQFQAALQALAPADKRVQPDRSAARRERIDTGMRALKAAMQETLMDLLAVRQRLDEIRH